jgi:hypothetical protein
MFDSQKYKYFDEDEFTCHCGCGKNDISPILVEMLDKARHQAAVPFVITSACRCHANNIKAGGKSISAHLFGLAVDISCYQSRNRFRILKALIEVGFHRIGLSEKFIHVDIDGTKDPAVMWTY